MMGSLVNPGTEIQRIEAMFEKHKRLDRTMAAIIPTPKAQCAPLGWDAVEWLQTHRSWLLLCEFSTFIDQYPEVHR